MPLLRMDRGLLNGFICISLLLIAFAAVVVNSASREGKKLSLPATMGQTFLTFWYPGTSGPLTLDGEWLGFPDQLLSPEDIEKNLNRSLPVYFPDVWHPPGPRRHMMTYTLLLRKVPQDTELGLFIPEIKNSFRLFVNGTEVLSGGQVSDSIDHADGYSGNRVISIGALPSDTRLVLQVSNYGHARGGVHSPPVLASADEWQKYYQRNILIEGVVICLATLAGILLLLEYRLVPDHKELLWIALFSMVLAGYTGTTGLGSFGTLFGRFPWELSVRLEYLGFATAIPLFINWLQSLFEKDAQFRLVRYINWASVFFLIVILLTPSDLFTELLYPLLGFMSLCILAAVMIMVRLFIRNRAGIRILVFGAFALIIAILHDLSVFLGVWLGGHLLGLGVLLFLVAQIGFLTYYRTQEQVRMLDFNRALQNMALEIEKLSVQRKEELEAHIVELEHKKREYRKLITEDELTGLINRHCFFEQISRRMDKNRRISYAIVMIDVDGFKQICDYYGREFSDLVLVRVAQQLKEEAEGHFDWIPARYGSDEFIFWLGGVDSDQASQIARRIQIAVSRIKIPLINRPGEFLRFSVSTGVAANKRDADLNQLLARAADSVHQQRKQIAERQKSNTGSVLLVSDRLSRSPFYRQRPER